MNPISLPSYDELNRELAKTTLKLHASQVHGLVCGILCGKPQTNSAWEDLVTGGKKSKTTHTLLQDLYTASAQQLEDFLFEFQLLLPNDEDDLPVRAEAMTLWCQGFLTGLKAAEIPIINREPSDMTEAINDLIEIAKMDYEQVVSSEEDEAAYFELVEFVRMAVILIYQDMHGLDTATRSNHLH